MVTVVPNSPADKAGLKGSGSAASGTPASGGDVITAVDGKPVASVQDLSAYLNTKQAGDTVRLSLLRNGQGQDVQVTLEAWPSRISSSTTPQPAPGPNTPGSRSRQFGGTVPGSKS